MNSALVDREQPLAALDRAAEARGGQLAIVRGRRRTGKTYLLQALVGGRRAIYYAATQQSAPVELASFTDVVRDTLGSDGLPPGYAFPDWQSALDFVTEHAGNERLVVVLDEFPYLAASSGGLESVVQRWWDQRGRTSPIMLVLCGSAMAYMAQIAGAAAPLHQRATVSLYLPPLDYRAADEFVPSLPARERAIVYGVLGGTPLYLEQWDERASLRDNLVRLFGVPTSPLVDAAELVLSGELPELEGAFRILQAVAFGNTQANKIQDYARVAVERPLKRLVALGILERRIPALDDPTRTKRALYRIGDPYFRFWFRFVLPNRSHVARGLGAQVVEKRILPFLDDHMGSVFEDMAREHARLLAAAGQIDADQIESWWSADGAHEIDLVGLSGRNRISAVGTVKWSARPLGRAVLHNLDEHAAALPGVTPGVLRLVYGRAGCDEVVASEPLVRCINVDELYAEP